jgi:hypothetical protein
MFGGSKDASVNERLGGLLGCLGTDKVQPILEEHGSGRYCKRLTNLQLLWVIVGFGLFPDKSYRELCRPLFPRATLIPSRAVICEARKRLSAFVLQCIHDAVVTLLATHSACPSAFYRGLRLIAVDGTLLNCYDSDANREFFGRPGNQYGAGAFPQLRLVTLCELGTRVLWRSVIGVYRDCERTLTQQLLTHLKPTHLLLADQHFGVAPLIYSLIDRRVPLLIRTKKGHVFPVEKRLSDGSYLSRIYLGKNSRACQRGGRTIRVIRYTLEDPARRGHRQEHVLLTTLLCPEKYPALELIQLYHGRWEEELAFREIKQTLHKSKVLRSQSPEMIKQEVWGLLQAHFVIRQLVYRAAVASKVPPSKISVQATVHIVQLGLFEASSKRPARKRRVRTWQRLLIADIRLEVLPDRQPRINPRVVKRRSRPRPTKQDHHRRPPLPNPVFAETVRIST